LLRIGGLSSGLFDAIFMLNIQKLEGFFIRVSWAKNPKLDTYSELCKASALKY
jgi:hypothetical protein